VYGYRNPVFPYNTSVLYFGAPVCMYITLVCCRTQVVYLPLGSSIADKNLLLLTETPCSKITHRRVRRYELHMKQGLHYINTDYNNS
jgi:hypothetical protein